MDPHRSSYSEEQDPRWYGGEQQQYADSEWDNSYEGYRVPDPRGERYPQADAQYAEPARMPSSGPVGRRSGEPLPPLPPDARGQMPPPGQPGAPPPGTGPGVPAGPGPAQGASRRRPGEAGPPDSIYRARRPATAVLVGAITAVLALPMLRVLFAGLGSPVSPAAVVSSVLMLLGLPLGALGMYGLATGAARVPDASTVRIWLRPPLAYLALALVLVVAAGLAAG